MKQKINKKNKVYKIKQLRKLRLQVNTAVQEEYEIQQEHEHHSNNTVEEVVKEEKDEEDDEEEDEGDKKSMISTDTDTDNETDVPDPLKVKLSNGNSLHETIYGLIYHEFKYYQHYRIMTSSQIAKESIKRLSVFMASYINHRNSNECGDREITKECLQMHFLTFLNRKFTFLEKYTVRYLNKIYQPATITKHLECIQIFFRWLGEDYFSRRKIVTYLYSFEKFCNKLLKNYRKIVTRSQYSIDKDISTLIEDRVWPEKGLPQLMAAVKSEDPFVQEIELMDMDLMTKQYYDRFMGILFSSICARSVNGRIGGIKSMSKGLGHFIHLHGHSYTTDFKTSNKYCLQPVVLDQYSRKLFGIYLQKLRPWICSQNNLVEDNDESPLWLRFDGKADVYFSRKIKTFFMRTQNLGITSNTIRSLVETTSNDLYNEDKITKSVKESVHNINGHSSATSKRYYVMKTREADILNSRIFMEALAPENGQ
jgi:hypothetical protein